jgi:hypothetical protein
MKINNLSIASFANQSIRSSRRLVRYTGTRIGCCSRAGHYKTFDFFLPITNSMGGTSEQEAFLGRAILASADKLLLKNVRSI